MSSAAGPIDERRQFAVLYRSFLSRVIDLQLLSASGDIRNLLAQLASLLAAYSFVLAVLTASHFAQSSGGHSKIGAGAWGLEEFLISTTLTVAGLFAVLAWDAILPHRRDSFVLDPLPLRSRTVFGAKNAALATALGVGIIAVNAFTGISIPLLVLPAGSGIAGAVRCLLAYRVTMTAAGAFIFVSVFALQNAAVAFLSYRLFQRISGFLQLLAFFLILALFFLTPPLATPSGLSSPANRHLLVWLPSFWFLGLFHRLNGSAFAAFAPLAIRAVWSLTAVCVFTLITVAFTYRRTIRRGIEQPDIAPGEAKGSPSKLASAFTLRMLTDPIDRAVLLFSARTLARSRQHRLVLAFYVGTAFAISLTYAKSLLYGTSDQRWDRPDVPLLITSLVYAFLCDYRKPRRVRIAVCSSRQLDFPHHCRSQSGILFFGRSQVSVCDGCSPGLGGLGHRLSVDLARPTGASASARTRASFRLDRPGLPSKVSKNPLYLFLSPRKIEPPAEAWNRRLAISIGGGDRGEYRALVDGEAGALRDGAGNPDWGHALGNETNRRLCGLAV